MLDLFLVSILPQSYLSMVEPAKLNNQFWLDPFPAILEDLPAVSYSFCHGTTDKDRKIDKFSKAIINRLLRLTSIFQVDILGDFVIIWKKGSTILALGDNVMSSDSRVKVGIVNKTK